MKMKTGSILVDHFLTVSPALFITFRVSEYLISLEEMPKNVRQIFIKVL